MSAPPFVDRNVGASHLLTETLFDKQTGAPADCINKLRFLLTTGCSLSVSKHSTGFHYLDLPR